jgi:hypothetical protein
LLAEDGLLRMATMACLSQTGKSHSAAEMIMFWP